MLPVGPKVAAIASSEIEDLTENFCTFLPFKAINVDASESKSALSAACNFLLADIFSFIFILRASKNLDALVQLVQPPR